MALFDKVCVSIFAGQKSSLYVFALFVDSTGGTAAKGVPGGLFDNKHVFVHSRGRGRPL